MFTTSVRNKSVVCSVVSALLLGVLPASAVAHTGGEASGFLHGVAHPFVGIDHLLAMVAVGLWAAQMNGRAVWLVPLTFVSVMALGCLLGMTAIALPYAEAGIVMSLLAFGVLIAAAVRLPLLPSAMIAGVFAIFHGYAHGAEMPQDASGLVYALGFLLATIALHASGIGAALTLKAGGRARMLRYTGAGVALCGGYLGFVS